jgi:hypothetical protein
VHSAAPEINSDKSARARDGAQVLAIVPARTAAILPYPITNDDIADPHSIGLLDSGYLEGRV